MIMQWLHNLNDLTGCFLLIIAFSLSSLARSVSALTREIECLHEDYDRSTQAHERHHWELQAKQDSGR